jgi:hypothetical protein
VRFGFLVSWFLSFLVCAGMPASAGHLLVSAGTNPVCSCELSTRTWSIVLPNPNCIHTAAEISSEIGCEPCAASGVGSGGYTPYCIYIQYVSNPLSRSSVMATCALRHIRLHPHSTIRAPQSALTLALALVLHSAIHAHSCAPRGTCSASASLPSHRGSARRQAGVLIS